ncbi:MAG: hypothetical protein HY360_12630 [Verrucomicrobia bacterium]|nr:hypothetical protein [Verrucomicrobiota bacterium]
MNSCALIGTFLLVAMAAPLVAEELVIAKDGKPTCTIVWAAAGNNHEEWLLTHAHAELARVFKKMTGREPSGLPESAVTNAAGLCIYLGATEFAKQHGIDPQALKHEEAVVKVADNALILIGNDRYPQLGTLHATTLFLQKDLGVRWLWPGELGEVIPKRAAITVPGALERREAPSLKVRYWRDVLGNGEMGKMAMENGWTTLEEIQKRSRESEEWSWCNRLQRVMGIPCHQPAPTGNGSINRRWSAWKTRRPFPPIRSG